MSDGMTTQLFAAMVATGGLSRDEDSGPVVSPAAVAAMFALVDGADSQATVVHSTRTARGCRKELRRALSRRAAEADRAGQRELAADLGHLGGLARQVDWALRAGALLE